MLKKSFWHKLRDLFRPQYYIVAKVETTKEDAGDSYISKTTLRPIFKDALVDMGEIKDLRELVLITTERDISL